MLKHLERIFLPFARALCELPGAIRARGPQATLAALAFALTSVLLVLSLAVPVRAADYTVGEVRRINKETKRITLRHGEIKSLEMPAMTMAYGVRDPKILEDLNVGDKVRFLAIKDASGELIVTSIRPVQ